MGAPAEMLCSLSGEKSAAAEGLAPSGLPPVQSVEVASEAESVQHRLSRLRSRCSIVAAGEGESAGSDSTGSEKSASAEGLALSGLPPVQSAVQHRLSRLQSRCSIVAA